MSLWAKLYHPTFHFFSCFSATFSFSNFCKDPHFRQQLGCYVSSPSEFRKINEQKFVQVEDEDKIWRLDLTNEAKKLLFGKVRLEAFFKAPSAKAEGNSTKAQNQAEATGSRSSKGNSKSDQNPDGETHPHHPHRPYVHISKNSENFTWDAQKMGSSAAKMVDDQGKGERAGEENENKSGKGETIDGFFVDKIRSLCEVEFSRINIVVFPYGTALLQFHINWLPKGQT